MPEKLTINFFLALYDFLGLNNKLKKHIHMAIFMFSPLLFKGSHIVFVQSVKTLFIQLLPFLKELFPYFRYFVKSLYMQLFLHFKWEFHKSLQACLLLYGDLHIARQSDQIFLKELLPFFDFQCFVKTFLLHFKREFLKTLHACFLTYLEIKITLQQFDHPFLKELFPFVKKFVCATLTSELRIP